MLWAIEVTVLILSKSKKTKRAQKNKKKGNKISNKEIAGEIWFEKNSVDKPPNAYLKKKHTLWTRRCHKK